MDGTLGRAQNTAREQIIRALYDRYTNDINSPGVVLSEGQFPRGTSLDTLLESQGNDWIFNQFLFQSLSSPTETSGSAASRYERYFLNTFLFMLRTGAFAGIEQSARNAALSGMLSYAIEYLENQYDTERSVVTEDTSPTLIKALYQAAYEVRCNDSGASIGDLSQLSRAQVMACLEGDPRIGDYVDTFRANNRQAFETDATYRRQLLAAHQSLEEAADRDAREARARATSLNTIRDLIGRMTTGDSDNAIAVMKDFSENYDVIVRPGLPSATVPNLYEAVRDVRRAHMDALDDATNLIRAQVMDRLEQDFPAPLAQTRANAGFDAFTYGDSLFRKRCLEAAAQRAAQPPPEPTPAPSRGVSPSPSAAGRERKPEPTLPAAGKADLARDSAKAAPAAQPRGAVAEKDDVAEVLPTFNRLVGKYFPFLVRTLELITPDPAALLESYGVKPKTKLLRKVAEALLCLIAAPILLVALPGIAVYGAIADRKRTFEAADGGAENSEPPTPGAEFATGTRARVERTQELPRRPALIEDRNKPGVTPGRPS